MSNEITVLKAEAYGLEENEGLTIEKAFLPKIEERNLLSVIYAELIKKDITEETVIEASDLRKKLVKVRTGISDIHKVQKAFFLAAGKFCDAWKNKETLPAVQMEEGTRKIENHFARIEAEKLQAIREGRAMELAKFYNEEGPGTGDLALMSDEVWGHYIKSVEVDFKAKKEAEKKAEEERIAKEKAEIEEQKRIKAENEKLKKDAELKKIADEIEEIERHKLAKIESDKRAKIEKDFLAKQAEESQIKALDQARIKKESEDKRKLELAPDKEKLKKWVSEMTIPIFISGKLSKESMLKMGEIVLKHDAFKNWAIAEIEKIK